MAKPRLNRISIVLDEKGLGQFHLAKLLDINKNTVSRWCRNTNQPKLSDLYKISKILRVNIITLIEPTDWSREEGPSELDSYLENLKVQEGGTKKSKTGKK